MFVDCPTLEIHEIKCSPSNNNFTVSQSRRVTLIQRLAFNIWYKRVFKMEGCLKMASAFKFAVLFAT